MASRHSMNLTKGSVLKNLVIFAMPILFTNLLQQLYHAADVYVVGNFSGTAEECKTAVAAVGSTGSLTSLLLNLFLGLSVGANVVCANLYGSGNKKDLGKAIETSLLLAAVSGVFIGVVGFFLAEPVLAVMGVPETVLPYSVRYMQIIFLGQPGSLVYNFGAGILRARGDTKRPMYILSAAGIINVVLNLFFVIVCKLGSTGVAIATSASHYFSAVAVLWILCHPAGEDPVELFHLRFHRESLSRILKVGIPSGLNGIVFSISNVVIATALNSLGKEVIAGNSAAANVDAFTYQILVAFYTASISFAGQNYGAKKFERIDKLLLYSCLVTAGVYFSVFSLIAIFPRFFVGIFISDPAVITEGIPRLYTIGAGYFIYIISEMCIGCLRGMGKTVLPTVLNAACICVPRMIWAKWVFPLNPSLGFLYLCYPISYVFSVIAQLVCYFHYMRKEKREYAAHLAAEEAETAEAAENGSLG